jgi:hypothetical protein
VRITNWYPTSQFGKTRTKLGTPEFDSVFPSWGVDMGYETRVLPSNLRVLPSNLNNTERGIP